MSIPSPGLHGESANTMGGGGARQAHGRLEAKAGGGEDVHSAAACGFWSQEHFLMGKKIRSEIDDFPHFYIWLFTILDFSYYGNLF